MNRQVAFAASLLTLFILPVSSVFAASTFTLSVYAKGTDGSTLPATVVLLDPSSQKTYQRQAPLLITGIPPGNYVVSVDTKTSGYTFTRWSDGSGQGVTRTIQLTADMTMTAIYSRDIGSIQEPSGSQSLSFAIGILLLVVAVTLLPVMVIYKRREG